MDIYAPTNVCVKDTGSKASMVLQKYQNFIEMSSNMIYIVVLGVGLKCLRKIDLNTQGGGGEVKWQFLLIFSAKNMLTSGIRWVKKALKCAYAIYEWSPRYVARNSNGCKTFVSI